MGFYSIKDLEKLSGIKAHTIRIWEKRYKIVEPSRTPTNIRFYTDNDLKRILNISILNNHGHKISHIAELDDKELSQRVLDLFAEADNQHVALNGLVVSMLELNERRFLNVLSDSVVKIGFENTIEQLIFPFLERIGIFWQTGTIQPAQEHFISALIRQKLIVAIDHELLRSTGNGKTVTFFLPENEQHELPLLFYSLIARKEGFDVIYLGSLVPKEDLKHVESIKPATAYFTAIISALDDFDVEQYLSDIKIELNGKKIIATGWQLKQKKIIAFKGVDIVQSIADFRTVLKQL